MSITTYHHHSKAVRPTFHGLHASAHVAVTIVVRVELIGVGCMGPAVVIEGINVASAVIDELVSDCVPPISVSQIISKDTGSSKYLAALLSPWVMLNDEVYEVRYTSAF